MDELDSSLMIRWKQLVLLEEKKQICYSTIQGSTKGFRVFSMDQSAQNTQKETLQIPFY